MKQLWVVFSLILITCVSSYAQLEAPADVCRAKLHGHHLFHERREGNPHVVIASNLGLSKPEGTRRSLPPLSTGDFKVLRYWTVPQKRLRSFLDRIVSAGLRDVSEDVNHYNTKLAQAIGFKETEFNYRTEFRSITKRAVENLNAQEQMRDKAWQLGTIAAVDEALFGIATHRSPIQGDAGRVFGLRLSPDRALVGLLKIGPQNADAIANSLHDKTWSMEGVKEIPYLALRDVEMSQGNPASIAKIFSDFLTRRGAQNVEPIVQEIEEKMRMSLEKQDPQDFTSLEMDVVVPELGAVIGLKAIGNLPLLTCHFSISSLIDQKGAPQATLEQVRSYRNQLFDQLETLGPTN